MKTSILSVVIPTSNRQRHLAEAVQSALTGTGDGIEVIVVPNGPDRSWETSLAPFRTNPQVIVSPIELAHANAARNHGISLATAEYLRFLDDDDLIYPGSSLHQCRLLQQSNADVCAGAVDYLDQENKCFDTKRVPSTDDFIESVLAPNHISWPASYVYRSSIIKSLAWDETLPFCQDKEWLYTLCREREWKWIRTDRPVGAWRSHDGPRISSTATMGHHLKMRARILIRTVRILEKQGRMNDRRKTAAADSLWRAIHAGFHLSPGYWSTLIDEVNELYPQTYPEVAIYKYPWGRRVPPLFMEYLMLPKRRLNHSWRVWKYKHGIDKSAIPP